MDSGAFELLREPICAVLGAREDQNLAPLSFLDQMHEQMPFLFLLHAIGALLDQLDRGVARSNLHRQRVVQQPFSQAPDIIRIGRGEQQILALLRQQFDDAADVVDETHVEHPVSLIEDQYLNLGEIQGALLREIEQAAGGRHQNVAAAAQGADLRIDADAAEHLIGSQRHVLAVIARALRNLSGEFTRRSENQRARRAAGAVRSISRETLQNGQYKACRLAGAGLRARENVASRKYRGYRLNLNGRRGVVAFIGDSTQQFGQ